MSVGSSVEYLRFVAAHRRFLGFGLLAAWIVMLFAGLSAGINGALTGTVFAELYGVLHRGAIRGAFRSAMITATAAAPLLMGLLLNAGWSLTHLLLAGALLLSLALLPASAQSHSFQSISVEGN
jgi:hypothetical protein